MATVAQPLGAATRRATRCRASPRAWPTSRTTGRCWSVISLGAFMAILDTTIVNVALPRIIQVFQSNVSTGQLVLAGYMLALAVVVPASGYLSDRFGAKRTYLVTIVLFTVGSALCGLAPSIEGLIVFRVIQGLGGGMLMPLGMSLLFQVAPPEPARHADGRLRAAAAGRADGRADARRLPGPVRRLAADLHPQRAGRHRWRLLAGDVHPARDADAARARASTGPASSSRRRRSPARCWRWSRPRTTAGPPRTSMILLADRGDGVPLLDRGRAVAGAAAAGPDHPARTGPTSSR